MLVLALERATPGHNSLDCQMALKIESETFSKIKLNKANKQQSVKSFDKGNDDHDNNE